jgi:aryl-alcohol dehydrogenase-like predicted oxidoreductase
MPLSNPGHPPEDRAIATIHAALGEGVELLDTADAYCEGEHDFGRGERLLAKALRGRSRDGLIVATKGGHTRPGGRWELDGRPEYLKQACEASLERLETDRIDLYQLHRPDPKVPFAESVGALRDLRDAGKVRWVGLSNVTVAQLEEAEGITPIDAIQNQLSLLYVEPLAKGEVAACEQRGIPYLAWAPLGGAGEAGRQGEGLPAVAAAASAHGVSPQRVALAWLVSLSPAVVPIPGSSRPETIRDSVAATRLELSPQEVAAIDAGAGVTRW